MELDFEFLRLYGYNKKTGEIVFAPIERAVRFEAGLPDWHSMWGVADCVLFALDVKHYTPIDPHPPLEGGYWVPYTFIHEKCVCEVRVYVPTKGT